MLAKHKSQSNTWTYAAFLLIGTTETNFIEIRIKYGNVYSRKRHLIISAANCGNFSQAQTYWRVSNHFKYFLVL